MNKIMRVCNPSVNDGEFALIKHRAGFNRFTISTRDVTGKTSLVCLQAKTGRYGGTYAHKDFAQKERLLKLNQIAIQQMRILQDVENRKTLTLPERKWPCISAPKAPSTSIM